MLVAPLDPGSIASYTTTFATIVSALVLLLVGAIADRSPRPARLLGGFAWTGAASACLLFFVKVSSRGWALGYLGGGLLLAVNLVIVSKPDLIGVDTGMAVRISMLSAGLWWAIFSLIPVLGLWNLRGVGATQGGELPAPAIAARGLVDQSLSQLLRSGIGVS